LPASAGIETRINIRIWFSFVSEYRQKIESNELPGGL